MNAEWLRQLLWFKVVSHPLLRQETGERWARAVHATLVVLPGQQVGKSLKWGNGGRVGVQRAVQGHGGILPARSRGAHVYGTQRVVVGGCRAALNGLRGAEGCEKGRG